MIFLFDYSNISAVMYAIAYIINTFLEIITFSVDYLKKIWYNKKAVIPILVFWTEESKMDIQYLKAEKEAIKARIAEVKQQRAQEKEYASECYREKLHSDAANHSYNARSLTETLNSLYDQLNSVQEEIQLFYDRQIAMWRISHCKQCGREIKYHVEWGHIPDMCKACIELEKAKWQITSCSKCGRTFKYNTEWSKIPSMCKECAAAEKANGKTKTAKYAAKRFTTALSGRIYLIAAKNAPKRKRQNGGKKTAPAAAGQYATTLNGRAFPISARNAARLKRRCGKKNSAPSAIKASNTASTGRTFLSYARNAKRLIRNQNAWTAAPYSSIYLRSPAAPRSANDAIPVRPLSEADVSQVSSPAGKFRA